MTPLSIYIHWPFCKSKCPYCDFNSHVRDGVDHARWRAALLKELGFWAKKLPDRKIASIFFGGGTPSLMQPDTVAALIDAVGQFWPMEQNTEITLEANPTSVEAANFKMLSTAGVNRVSLGVQALNMEDLAFLGRHHSVDEALGAVALAREYFPRMSFDLIYVRPGQTLAAWEAELSRALEFTKGHISLYQLTIEENTAFYTAYKKGEFVMPGENIAADMYLLTQQITESYGMPAYEISNHACEGQESRHNLAYWKSEDFIGIGPGAHGRYSVYNGGRAAPDVASATSPLRGHRQKPTGFFAPPRSHESSHFHRYATDTLKSPERWLEKVEDSGAGLLNEIAITDREHIEEAVMMGLRLRDGIRYDDWQQRAGFSLQDTLPEATVRKLREQSLIVADEQHIKTTEAGRLLLNSITKELLITD